MAFSADVYKYAIYYAVCAETDKYGNLQNYLCDTDPTTPIRLSTYSYYGDEPMEEMETGLRIVKYQAGTTIPLSGALFEVITPSGDTLGTFVTNYNGEINIPLTIMVSGYGFTANQISALDELLLQRDVLLELAGNLTAISAATSKVLKELPEDLPEDREAVIRAACSLVGKINYFWGGKSHAIGWDNRWGQIYEVTAADSPTTGTYRPYGMDCSGYVDWVFNNALGYIIGHGGGAAMQHTYCTDITWDDAQIGDLAFYPDDEHVGIVAGWDEEGNILIVHCASGYNNVVITGKEGFISVARPDIFTEEVINGAT